MTLRGSGFTPALLFGSLAAPASAQTLVSLGSALEDLDAVFSTARECRRRGLFSFLHPSRDIHEWSDLVFGDLGVLLLFGRDSLSGTHDHFREKAPCGGRLKPTATGLPTAPRRKRRCLSPRAHTRSSSRLRWDQEAGRRPRVNAVRRHATKREHVARAIAAAAALLTAAPGVSAAGTEVSPQGLRATAERAPLPSGTGDPRASDGRRTWAQLPKNLGRSALGVFALDSLAPLTLGATATGIAFAAETDVDRAIGSNPSGLEAEIPDILGGPAVSGGAVLGLFIWGRHASPGRFRDASYDLLPAFAVAWTFTKALKLATGRARPDGTDDRSFPSGHASNAFALASVLDRHLGPKAAVPAYATAAAIALSRLRKDRHNLTDVLAGATLGYLVGTAVVRSHGGRSDAPVQVSPVLPPGGGIGLAVHLRLPF